MTAKRAYLTLLMRQSAEWLAASAANPTSYMRPIRIKLHYVAIRRKTGARPIRRRS